MDARSLIKTLESQIREAESTAETVGEQRARNHRFYSLQPIGNEIAGRSQYISPDVLDAVEAKKSYFTETFFSARQVVKFKPTGMQTQEAADARTAYCNRQLALNNHYALFRDGWHDAFVAKRMVILSEWKDGTETIVLELHDASHDEAMAAIQANTLGERVIDVKTDRLDQKVGEDGQIRVSGQVGVVVDRGRVELTLVQPERYYRDGYATYVSDASFAAIDMESSRQDLVRDGYDEEQVSKLGKEYRFRSSEEDVSRKAHDASWSARRGQGRDKVREMVTHYKTWVWMNLYEYDPELYPDEVKLYRICWADGEILRYTNGQEAITAVDEMPFFEWTEYKIAHAEHGMADADVLAHSQRVQSTLKRLIIDNQQMRNTSRYEAVHTAIKNPRDLLDNQIGGVVWSRQIGSVSVLATPELSPLTFNVIQMLKEDAESRSGVTALQKGMNSDAIRYQNAADMIERLTNSANRRIMKAARDFANTFLVPLCKHIVKVGLRHDKRTHVIEAQGRQLMMTPAKMPQVEMEMQVHVALTPDEGQRFAQTLMMMHTALTNPQAPSEASKLYGIQQQHALWDDALDALGVSDSSRYLMRPDSPEFQQMMEQQQAQVQQAQQQAQQAQQMQIQLAIDQWATQKQVLLSTDQRQWMEAELKRAIDTGRLELEATDKMADNVRQDEDADHQQRVDYAKLRIEKERAGAAA